MPHYKTGDECKIGDRVRGYNYTHSGIVEGIVVAIRPADQRFNISVTYPIISKFDNAVLVSLAVGTATASQLEKV